MGPNLGSFTAKNRRTRGKTTQNRPMRGNNLANQLLFRDKIQVYRFQ